MVKTRNQQLAQEKEEEKLRNLPPSTLPPKVCRSDTPCTPLLVKKTKSASSIYSAPATKKKKLMFAPGAPQEFEFEMTSPPLRRLKTDSVHDSVVRIEFEMRTGEGVFLREIGEKERNKFKEWIIEDLKSELKKMHGLSCDFDDDVDSLRSRLELAETLRRRVEIRRCQASPFIPNELSLKEIQKELAKRRFVYAGLSYFQACETLERSVLKEDALGLIGEGYQFGRRLVSANDIVSMQQPSDKELRTMLQTKNPNLPTIPKKKEEKLQLLSQCVETEEEQLVRNLIKEELVRELTRRKLNKPENINDLNSLFEALFASKQWKLEYPDVDNTPLTEQDEQASNCVVS